MWFYVLGKSVCELIPSCSLCWSSSINSVLSFQRLNVMCWVISCPLRNEMLRCSKSELAPENLLLPACRQGNFSHSGFGGRNELFHSGKFIARLFTFVFIFILFPASYRFPFFTVYLLLFFQGSVCEPFIRKTWSHKPLSFHNYDAWFTNQRPFGVN